MGWVGGWRVVVGSAWGSRKWKSCASNKHNLGLASQYGWRWRVEEDRRKEGRKKKVRVFSTKAHTPAPTSVFFKPRIYIYISTC